MTTFAENRNARADYEVLERITSGLELTGQEVKSIRGGKISLQGAFVSMRGGEAYLLNADIPPYQPKNAEAPYDRARARRLLLTREELAKLSESEATKGLTIVPLSVYNKGRFIKLDIALARGRKKFDKRQAIKKRDVERDLKRSLKI